ncbi:MAG TPA: acyl-CoA dehydrogenase family protein, partial [Streptosporangiaceae bacterium]
MALGLTPEHLELAAAVRGWSQRHCPAEVVRSAVDGSDSGAAQYRAELAPSLAGQGPFGLHLPEAAGGQGFGLPELAVALEETGRALLPGAFLPTVLASAVLAESVLAESVLAESVLAESAGAAGAAGPAGADSVLRKLLARLADGSLSGTVSLAAGLTGVLDP